MATWAARTGYRPEPLQIIRQTHEYVDLYKIGFQLPLKPLIDWNRFGHEAIALCEETECPNTLNATDGETDGKQHVEIHRKKLLRRQLLRYAAPGAVYVPFCGRRHSV